MMIDGSVPCTTLKFSYSWLVTNSVVRSTSTMQPRVESSISMTIADILLHTENRNRKRFIEMI